MTQGGKHDSSCSKLPSCRRVSHILRNVVSNITVEPALFIMFLGLGLDHSTLDQMQIDKCCRDDFNFNQTVCEHLTEDQYETESLMVSDEVKSLSYIVD